MDRAHTLLDKGTNRRAFSLGQVDKYTWVDTGSSFAMSDLLAAFLLGQLQEKDRVLAKRRGVAEHYQKLLKPLEAELDFRCMHVPADRDQAHHMYYVLLGSSQIRESRTHYLERAGRTSDVPLCSAPLVSRWRSRLRHTSAVPSYRRHQFPPAQTSVLQWSASS